MTFIIFIFSYLHLYILPYHQKLSNSSLIHQTNNNQDLDIDYSHLLIQNVYIPAQLVFQEHLVSEDIIKLRNKGNI